MTASTVSTESLGWLIKLLGPEAVADMTRPLTDEEYADVEAALARHGGDPVAAAGVHVDADTAAFMRSLPVGGRR
jgi:hypothetical protein